MNEDMKTITFQVSRTQEIEPSVFFYGIVIESQNINSSIQQVEDILKDNNRIQKEEIQNHSYTLSEGEDELKSVYIIKVKGRNELQVFTKQLRQIQGVRGGIIKTELEDIENREFELIEELTQVAKSKAEKYAQLCGKKVLEITSFKVENNPKGGWSASPPIRAINKESIYRSIMMRYDKKDKFEISRTVEVQFEMR